MRALLDRFRRPEPAAPRLGGPTTHQPVGTRPCADCGALVPADSGCRFEDDDRRIVRTCVTCCPYCSGQKRGTR